MEGLRTWCGGLLALGCAAATQLCWPRPGVASGASPTRPSQEHASERLGDRILERHADRLGDRLEADRASLRDALERMRELPWREAWAERLDALLSEDDPQAPEDARWIAARHGWFPGRTVRFARDWNRPAEGRALERCIDFERELHPFGTITDLHRRLASRGIDLLVVPVPTRLAVYPEYAFPAQTEVPIGADFRGYAEGTTRFLLALSEAGVEVVDLLPVLAADRFPDPESDADAALGEVFLTCNSHWAPRAARRAAAAVADRVQCLPNWRACEPPPLGAHEVAFEEGFAGAPIGARLPSGAMPDRVRYERVLAPGGGALEVRDADSPVLVIGDSFVKYFHQKSASFDSHLAASLGHAIDVISVSGGGALQTRQLLARRQQNGLATKRVVVWLFSAANLADEEDWRAVALLD